MEPMQEQYPAGKVPSTVQEIPGRTEMLQSTRERVNQVIVEFKQRNFISVDADHRIRVLDRRGLARYCR